MIEFGSWDALPRLQSYSGVLVIRLARLAATTEETLPGPVRLFSQTKRISRNGFNRHRCYG